MKKLHYEQWSDEQNAWRGGTALAVFAGALSLIVNAAVYCQESHTKCQNLIVLFFTLLVVLGTIISIGAFDTIADKAQPGVDRADIDRGGYFVCFGLQVVAFIFFSIASLWDLKGLLVVALYRSTQFKYEDKFLSDTLPSIQMCYHRRAIPGGHFASDANSYEFPV
jgi:hypothetical protein